MTPDDRAQSELKLLNEYEEKSKYLAILDRQLQDGGARLKQIGRDLETGGHAGDISDLFKEMASLQKPLEDYRATLIRCTNIYQSLTRYGNRVTLQDVRDSYPSR